MWQAVVLTAIIGVFAVVFLTGITLIGLNTDPSGSKIEPPEEAEGGTSEEAEGRMIPGTTLELSFV